MKRLHALVLCCGLLVLAGCGRGDNPVLTAPSPSSNPPSTPAAQPTSTPATSTPPPTPAGTASATASPDSEPGPAFPADTRVDTEEPTGGPLSVVAVRVARQDGFDRVVFELDGRQSGEPGWRVEYTDDPAQQGSGNRVQVQGDQTLAVIITGVGFPMDTGVEEENDDPDLPPGLAVITDVVLGATFEGQYQAFVGTARKAPFRVFRLSNPSRVVIDVRSD